jgi:hypothetical protein
MGRKAIQLGGERFGRLIVQARAMESNDSGCAMWICSCDCGSTVLAAGYLLKRGSVKSCGCLRNEIGAKHLQQYSKSHKHPALRHGEARSGAETTEWQLWHSIKRRCKSHPDYLGNGVKMCQEWESSFERFVIDIGRRPSAEYSLDRINVSGNYEPGNVRWATKKEQARNRRNSLFIECNGLRLTLAEWAERTGLKNTTIRSRLRFGWSAERALGVGD